MIQTAKAFLAGALNLHNPIKLEHTDHLRVAFSENPKTFIDAHNDSWPELVESMTAIIFPNDGGM